MRQKMVQQCAGCICPVWKEPVPYNLLIVRSCFILQVKFNSNDICYEIKCKQIYLQICKRSSAANATGYGQRRRTKVPQGMAIDAAHSATDSASRAWISQAGTGAGRALLCRSLLHFVSYVRRAFFCAVFWQQNQTATPGITCLVYVHIRT